MANRYLMPIYKELFESDFSYQDFDNRMEMQKAIYLLQDMGVPVGDYGFRWYLHGPYSQTLQDDMYYEQDRDLSINLSSENAESIGKLHDVIHLEKPDNYTRSQWIECLASLRYLQENVLRSDASEEEIVSELEQRKQHLNDHTSNLHAFHLVKGLFAR